MVERERIHEYILVRVGAMQFLAWGVNREKVPLVLRFALMCILQIFAQNPLVSVLIALSVPICSTKE